MKIKFNVAGFITIGCLLFFMITGAHDVGQPIKRDAQPFTWLDFYTGMLFMLAIAINAFYWGRSQQGAVDPKGPR